MYKRQLIFHLCTKGKVPVFLGSSFAFIPVIVAVSEKYNGDLRYAQGGIIVVGLIYVAVSFLIKKIEMCIRDSIRPLYYVEEEAIIRFIKYTGLWPLNCACMAVSYTHLDVYKRQRYTYV